MIPGRGDLRVIDKTYRSDRVMSLSVCNVWRGLVLLDAYRVGRRRNPCKHSVGSAIEKNRVLKHRSHVAVRHEDVVQTGLADRREFDLDCVHIDDDEGFGGKLTTGTTEHDAGHQRKWRGETHPGNRSTQPPSHRGTALVERRGVDGPEYLPSVVPSPSLSIVPT